MLENRSKKRIGGKIFASFLVGMLLSFLMISVAEAAPTTVVTTAGDMLTRINNQFPNLMRLVTAFGYIAGMYFIIMGIMKFKHMGESRTMMSQEHSIKGPLIFIAIGTALIFLPSAVSVGMSTFWNDPNPLGYEDASAQWSGIFTACFAAVQLLGVIAFIRGLLILSHLAGQSGGQQGSLAKAMTHIVGGIFCINIYGFTKVILATIGVTISGFNG